jgi:hypothetical protein
VYFKVLLVVIFSFLIIYFGHCDFLCAHGG